MSEKGADSAPNSSFSALNGPHSQTGILVSVTGPQSHLALAQTSVLPTSRRQLPYKRPKQLCFSYWGREERGDHGFHQHSAVGEDVRLSGRGQGWPDCLGRVKSG